MNPANKSISFQEDLYPGPGTTGIVLAKIFGQGIPVSFHTTLSQREKMGMPGYIKLMKMRGLQVK